MTKTQFTKLMKKLRYSQTLPVNDQSKAALITIEIKVTNSYRTPFTKTLENTHKKIKKNERDLYTKAA